MQRHFQTGSRQRSGVAVTETRHHSRVVEFDRRLGASTRRVWRRFEFTFMAIPCHSSYALNRSGSFRFASLRLVWIVLSRKLERIGTGIRSRVMNLQSDLTPLTAEPQCAPSWFAVRVLPRHEKMVNSVLGHKGFETFLPMYSRRHRYSSRTRCFDLPLFPGYLFCRLDLSTRLPLLTTPGVIQMVGVGRTPIPVDEQEIVAIQRAVESRLPLTPVSGWQAGQRGRITDGPLTGLEGAIVRVKAAVRLVLSVTLLQRSVCVEIDGDCVALV